MIPTKNIINFDHYGILSRNDSDSKAELIASTTKYREILGHANKGLAEIDQLLLAYSDDFSPVNTQILSMIANQQKQVVLSMLGGNAEQKIAAIIQGAIDIYTDQLDRLNGINLGGEGGFTEALWIMWDSQAAGYPAQTETSYEDMIQIMLLDVMVNNEKYGLSDWYAENADHISHVLESIGSGSHSLHESAYDSPEKMGKWVEKLYGELLDLDKNGEISNNSFMKKIFQRLGAHSITPEKINALIIKNWEHKEGSWRPSVQEGVSLVGSTNISPMLRMFFLSELLSKKSLSQEDIHLILTGQTRSLDDYMFTNYGQSSNEWFFKNNDKWQMQIKDGIEQVDWIGDGISINDLRALYVNFPGRDLTEEEMQQVNRWGDQVKMMQQTLKYWIQLCGDGQLAIGRNI